MRRLLPSRAGRLVVLGGIGVGLAALTPWFEPGSWSTEQVRTHGWDKPDPVLSQVAIVVALAVAVLAFLIRRRRIGLLLMVASAVSVALLTAKLVAHVEESAVGIYLALGAAAVQLVGAYRLFTGEAEDAAVPEQVVAEPEPEPEAESEAEPEPEVAAEPEPEPEPVPEPEPEPTTEERTAWPETVELLNLWLRKGDSIDSVAADYRANFDDDIPRMARLNSEVTTLLTQDRTDEADLLFEHCAPNWAQHGGHEVLTQLASQIVGKRHD